MRYFCLFLILFLSACAPAPVKRAPANSISEAEDIASRENLTPMEQRQLLLSTPYIIELLPSFEGIVFSNEKYGVGTDIKECVDFGLTYDVNHNQFVQEYIAQKEIENELIESEKKYNSINQNLKEIQSKLFELKEKKARNEATIEGIENRKKDLLYSVKSELNIENESNILSQSDLSQIPTEDLPSLEVQSQKVEKMRKKRESLGSVNLRADEETQKYEAEIQEYKTTLLIYFEKPVGISEHANHIEEMNDLVEKMTNAYDKMVMLKNMFSNTYSKL